MKDKVCSCIIPFHNDGKNLLRVLQIITKIKYIKDIVCVDDGSTDNYYLEIQQQYPALKVIKLPAKTGKSEAIAQGLKYTKYNNTFLIDADLLKLQQFYIEKAIQTFIHDEKIDLLILRRMDDVLYCKILRWDILFSGERILRKEDLENIFKRRVIGYQLELAMNQYMIDKGKQVYWVPNICYNPYKFEKTSFIKGFTGEITAGINIFSHLSFTQYMYQALYFCRRQYVNTGF